MKIKKVILLCPFVYLISSYQAHSQETPRTSWGDPLLQGYWTNTTVVPLERPIELGYQEFYTREEALEILATDVVEQETEFGTVADVHYQLDDYGLSREQTDVVLNLRTSILTVPRNGRLPKLTASAIARSDELDKINAEHGFDSAQSRPYAERCIMWRHEGPPLLPIGYNSNLQIQQTPEFVVIITEMIHDARVIPMRSSAPESAKIPRWQGSSWAHWEGDTLVIETTGFSGRLNAWGTKAEMSTSAKVVERLRRNSEDTIDYEFMVEDPTIWEAPWGGSYPMLATTPPLFEYACHEGNYGLENNLRGARAEEVK